jgi:hypothetical protein
MDTLLTLLGLVIGIEQLRRTEKPKQELEPFMPTCTTILGASVGSGISDLPTFHPGMRRMGLDR